MSRLKAIFMGTPEFAVPCLAKLHEQCEVIAVITQPDRPSGRGQKLKASPVKEYAQQAGLMVLQPEKIKTAEFTEILQNLHPELIVVVAFGQLLSPEILAIPPRGCVNVHASLLPYYRGAAPIHWAIINGESQSGVTTMFMDEGLDTGDMILAKSVNISQAMTTGQLHDALMVMGAELLGETVDLIANRQIKRQPQNQQNSTYAPLLTKATEKIDWSLSAKQIHDRIRGLNPWPGAYCLLAGKVMKIWRTECSAVTAADYQPGQILQLTARGFLVGTGEGILEVLELQPANKRKMTAKDYVCGKGIVLNECFD